MKNKNKMLNLKKRKEKGYKIYVKIPNIEKGKGKLINYIDKKNVKILNKEKEKENQIASVIKANKKRKKNQNTFDKIMLIYNKKSIASHIFNNKKIYLKSMKCLQNKLVILKESKIYSMKNVKKSKI